MTSSTVRLAETYGPGWAGRARNTGGHSPPRQQATPHCPQGLRGQIPNVAAADASPTAGGDVDRHHRWESRKGVASKAFSTHGGRGALGWIEDRRQGFLGYSRGIGQRMTKLTDPQKLRFRQQATLILAQHDKGFKLAPAALQWARHWAFQLKPITPPARGTVEA